MIEKNIIVANGFTSIERCLVIEGKIDDEEYYINIIKNDIDENKEIIETSYTEEWGNDQSLVVVISREKDKIKRANKITEKLKRAFDIDYVEVDITKNGWIRVESCMDLTKKNIGEIEELLNVNDWKITFSYYEGTQYLYLKCD